MLESNLTGSATHNACNWTDAMSTGLVLLEERRVTVCTSTPTTRLTLARLVHAEVFVVLSWDVLQCALLTNVVAPFAHCTAFLHRVHGKQSAHEHRVSSNPLKRAFLSILSHRVYRYSSYTTFEPSFRCMHSHTSIAHKCTRTT